MSDIDEMQTKETHREIKQTRKQMSGEEMEDIGRKGEEIVYKHFWENCYDGKIHETPTGFQVKGEHEEVLLEVIWNNKEKNTYAPADFEIKEKVNGKKEFIHKYIEVKTTKEDKESPAEVTRNQLKLMKKHSTNFSIYRVYDIFRKPRIVVFDNPYDTILLSPKLTQAIHSMKIMI